MAKKPKKPKNLDDLFHDGLKLPLFRGEKDTRGRP